LRVSPKTLANWRIAGGKGPPFLKIGGAVRYRFGDLRQFLSAAIRSSTSEEGAHGG
jgi:hypothetical protein